MKGLRQSNSGGLSFIEAGHTGQDGGVVDLEPCGWGGNPAPHW